MKLILSFLILIFLAACSSPQPTTQIADAAPTFATPTSMPTSTIVSATATFLPMLAPTATPIPCDSYIEDYCITDGHFVLQRPIAPPYNDSVDGTYRYASTANGTRDPHHGIEIGKDYGTPVQAAADGVVLFAGPDQKARFSPWINFYGNMIVIQHDDVFTLYAHLSKIDVQEGQAVTMGQKIGEVGQSGAATGSHLHFEARRGDVEDYFATVNPELWIAPKPSCGALMISVVDGASRFQSAKLTIQQYSDANEALMTYYLTTYDSRLAAGIENAGMSDLFAGRYRIAFVYYGRVYERWVDVQAGKLTQTVIVVK